MENKHTFHILIRFSDSLLKDSDTIFEHNSVIVRKGAVWLFGKMGSPVSQNNIDILNGQVQKGIPTFAYLVKGNRRKSTAYRGRLLVASNMLPEKEKHMTPNYYAELDFKKYMKFWVKLEKIEPVSLTDLKKMRVASSILPIEETLVKSSTGHFIICEDDIRI